MLIIVIYETISVVIDKSFILPRISEILISLKNIIFGSKFFITIISTLFRTFFGVLISFLLGILLACISYKYRMFEELFNPLYIILKTIPNITYIIIALIWLGRSGSVILVAATVIFPIFYNSILSSLKNIDKELIEYTSLFNYSYLFKTFNIFLPLIKIEIINSIKNCLSLAFKVSIMAEILSQIKNGIGRELYYAKSNFLMADIFAWTIIIVILSYLFDLVINVIAQKENN